VLLIVVASPDGEPYVGGQQYYFDDQDQQENYQQGKYSMGIPCPIYIIVNYLVICMCQF